LEEIYIRGVLRVENVERLLDEQSDEYKRLVDRAMEASIAL